MYVAWWSCGSGLGGVADPRDAPNQSFLAGTNLTNILIASPSQSA